MEYLKIIQFAKITLKIEYDALALMAKKIDENFAKAVLSIYQCKGKIVVSGIGKSAYIAQKIVASLNSIGVPSQFLHAAEAIHGDLGMLNPEDVIICLSKSGNSPEIQYLTPLLKGTAQLITITSNAKSILAQQSDIVLLTPSAQEADAHDLIPTTSTTVQLAMGDALVVALTKLNQFSKKNFAQYHPGGTLGKKLLWKVADIIDSSQKPSVSPNATIREVIISISASRFGMTTVMDGPEIVGVITDGDLRRMLEKVTSLSNIEAQNIMSRQPKNIQKDMLATEALYLLKKYDIGQLIVMNGILYHGILDIHDLLKEGII
ncbi:MAG: KpsF/GutQ family sugar-phosphate isomerase [Flavobacteriales bacterium AspAUS03]